MDIMYNTEDKEVVIIFGYGLGNHLSLYYLKGILNDIKKVFPLKIQTLHNLLFLEVADSSRRHRYHWYTRFKFDLSDEYKAGESYLTYNSHQIFCIGSHKNGVDGWSYPDESAADCMNRMIHD